MTFWNQKVLHMTILITWFTNTSKIGHTGSADLDETSHTLAYKEQICEYELARGEKNARVFFTPPAETVLVISSNTLWLHASGKLAQEVHSLAAAPRGPENIHSDSKHSGKWSVFLGKLLSQRFGMISVGYVRNITVPPVTVLCCAVSMLSLCCTLTSIVSVMKINNADYL